MNKEPLTRIYNIDTAYPSDMATGIALIWIGCRYSGMPALISFIIGAAIILATVLTPNVQAFVEWRIERKAMRVDAVVKTTVVE